MLLEDEVSENEEVVDGVRVALWVGRYFVHVVVKGVHVLVLVLVVDVFAVSVVLLLEDEVSENEEEVVDVAVCEVVEELLVVFMEVAVPEVASKARHQNKEPTTSASPAENSAQVLVIFASNLHRESLGPCCSKPPKV